MTNPLELRLRITGDGSGLSASLRDAEGNITHLGQSGQTAGERVNAGMTSARRSADALRASLSDSQRLMTGMSIAGQAALDPLVTGMSRVGQAVNQNNRLMADAQRISEQFRSAQSVFAQHQASLDTHLEAGRISADTYQRAISRYRTELDRANDSVSDSQRLMTGMSTAGRAALDPLATGMSRVGQAVNQNNRLMADAQRISEQFRSAQSVFAEHQAQLNAHLNAGRITVETYQSAIGRYRTELMSANQAAMQSGSALTAFRSGLNSAQTAIAGLGLVALARDILQTNREMESLRVQMVSVTGSTEKGALAFNDMLQLATDTPFEIKDLTKAYVMLKNFGLEPTAEVMDALTNQVSKLGGSADTLGGVTLALGQAWGKGKLQAQDINQMVERGVPVYDLLTQVTGKQSAELLKMSENGEITREVMEKLIKIMGEMASGSNARAMGTLNGKISVLADSWHKFEDALLNDKSEGVIKKIITNWSAWLDLFTNKLEDTYGYAQKLDELNERIANRKLIKQERKDHPISSRAVETVTKGLRNYQSDAELEAAQQQDLAMRDKLLKAITYENNAKKRGSDAEAKKLADSKALAKTQAEIAEHSKAVADWSEKYANNSQKLATELALAKKELGKDFTPELEKAITAKFTPKPPKPPKAPEESDLHKFETALAERKIAYEQENDLRSWSKQQEKDYWDGVIANYKGNSKTLADLQKKAADAELEALRDKRDKQIQLTEVISQTKTKIAELRGEASRDPIAIKLRLEVENADLIKKLRAGGQGALADQYLGTLLATEQANLLQSDIGTVQQRTQAQETRINLQHQSGAISQFEAQQKLKQLYKESADQLDAMAEKMTALGDNTGFESVKVKALEAKNAAGQLRVALPDVSRQIIDAGQTAAINAMADGLTNVANGAESAGQAFANMGLSVVKAIQAIAAQKLAEQVIGTVINLAASAFAGPTGGGTDAGINTSNVGMSNSISSFLSRANGGLITGPGTETSDSIGTTFPVGTFILKAASVKKIGLPALDALTKGANDASFGAGQVPVRVSNREYAVLPDLVAKHGRNFWEHLNKTGTVPPASLQRAYAGGGMVGGSSSTAASAHAQGAITVNVPVTLNQPSGEGGKIDPSVANVLAKQINNAVVSEILKQQRPGGSLYGGKR